MSNVLLVEDNDGDIFLIKEAFKEVNPLRKIEVAKDGEEAISFLTKQPKNFIKPDLIILDINLPKRSGHEVLAFIKQNEQLKHIPVVMLSTSSSQKDINNAYKHFVNSYISKPIDSADFDNIITHIENYWFQINNLPTAI